MQVCISSPAYLTQPAAAGGGASFTLAASDLDADNSVDMGTASAGDLLVGVIYTEGTDNAGTLTLSDGTNGSWTIAEEYESTVTSGSPNWNQRIAIGYVLSSAAGAVVVTGAGGTGTVGGSTKCAAWRFSVTGGPATFVDSAHGDGTGTAFACSATVGACGLAVAQFTAWSGDTTNDVEIPDNTNADAELTVAGAAAGHRIASMTNPDAAATNSISREYIAIMATFI